MNETVNNAFARVLEARNPNRPYTMDLLDTIFEDFVEIHGDRRYADDAAMVCGFARLEGRQVVVIGQQKGRDMNQRRHRNFAMSKPEGYRKALRTMLLAEKFGRPVITFVDTPGAYPGIDAEERGQAEAIAYNLREMSKLKVPSVVVILGEGGSGGALAIGVGDRVLMMENSVYSVITPEGCAAILWKDAGQSARAADCLRLTAQNLKEYGLVDEIIAETTDWKVENLEGQEEGFDAVTMHLKAELVRNLDELSQMSPDQLVRQRFQKFRRMGEWIG